MENCDVYRYKHDTIKKFIMIFYVVQNANLEIVYSIGSSGSVVVTAYDFESGRPGSNPECGLIYY